MNPTVVAKLLINLSIDGKSAIQLIKDGNFKVTPDEFAAVALAFEQKLITKQYAHQVLTALQRGEVT